jgi:hypothetical protein
MADMPTDAEMKKWLEDWKAASEQRRLDLAQQAEKASAAYKEATKNKGTRKGK